LWRFYLCPGGLPGKPGFFRLLSSLLLSKDKGGPDIRSLYWSRRLSRIIKTVQEKIFPPLGKLTYSGSRFIYWKAKAKCGTCAFFADNTNFTFVKFNQLFAQCQAESQS
jgi:hypothetical protein